MKTRRVTKNGISWVEVVTLPPPEIDQPIRPLASGPPEAILPGGLYGDPGRNAADRRRRKADAVLQKAGLRPAPWT